MAMRRLSNRVTVAAVILGALLVAVMLARVALAVHAGRL
jgi:membrane-associated phospholipid phosphatase